MPRFTSVSPTRRRFAGALVAVLLLLPVLAVPVRSSVTSPVPDDAPPAPPPIPEMPVAGATAPPAALIADPITPEAVCGGWGLQNAYGGMWPTSQLWWEFSCEYTYGPCIDVGACNADQHSSDRTTYRDHFVYSGSIASFYGEYSSAYVWIDFYGLYACDLWWDEPTTLWYVIGGETCPGGATPSPAPSVTPTPTPTLTPVPNQPPVAVARVGCEALACTYDGSGSSDPDGGSLAYRWAFGDGSVDVAASGVHAYAAPGTYSVRLDVVDDLGASGTATSSVSPVVLHATAAKVRGVARVDLTWAGAAGARFVVSRDGAAIATITGTAYTDQLGKGRTGTYRYRVCQEAVPMCSATVTVAVP